VGGPMTETVLEALYRRFLTLQQEGRNGIWARLIKNAFAPVLVGHFDFVVGNPPWVNWDSLSAEYREATKRLWVDYGLFSLKGHAARLGGGKKDLAMLFAYAAIGHYLKKGGKLGFVITQTVFKTKGAGEGFRRFRLGKKGDHLRILHVDDLSRLQPFEGASNRTSVMVCQRGQQNRYPVPYTYWKPLKRARIPLDHSLSEVSAETERFNFRARPVDEQNVTSQWITAREGAIRAISNVVGASQYQATAGATTCGADGVYLMEVLDVLSDGNLLVRNLNRAGKKQVEEVVQNVEPDLVYPVLRGKDAKKWRPLTSVFVLMVQDPKRRVGLDEHWLKINLPQTYSYLHHFEPLLLERKSKVLPIPPFYSIYGVGEQTFSPCKVVWGRVANEVNACVISSVATCFSDAPKLVLPFEAIIIPLDHEQEAHYVCAMINSSPARIIIRSYIVLHPDTHVLQHVNIPRFDAGNHIHTRLVVLSQRAHQLAEAGDEPGLAAVEAQVDEAARELWGITDRELKEIQRSLQELE
jgi:hypothetical protein